MIRIIFRGIEESQLAKDVVLERLQSTIDRFPDLEGHRTTNTLSMDNSQFKSGPDLFKIKFLIEGPKYSGVILEKSNISLYAALADLSEHTLERLNRFGDKQRVKNRTLARKLSKRHSPNETEEFDEPLSKY